VPRLVLCPRWRVVFSVRWTLVMGATDADVSVWWLTLVRALLKEATDAVVLKRRTRLMRLCAVWELTGLRPSSDGRAASVATDASVGAKMTVGNLTTRDTWRASEQRTLDAASVAMATYASVAPRKSPSEGATAIFVLWSYK
jgi:hypothetical protein